MQQDDKQRSRGSIDSIDSVEDDNNIFIRKQWFLKPKMGLIEDYYELHHKQVIGTGTYGSVIKGQLKGTNIIRAIKILRKSQVQNPKRLLNEINIMRNLDHPNIIKLYETFEDLRNIYLVMEFCEGGELLDRITAKKQFDEAEARLTFLQIAQAINYCHQNRICHRDLKPENFLYLNNSEGSPLKMIDFGFSTPFIERKNGKDIKVNLTTQVGTAYYIAPDVLQGVYDQGCDIWSMGVLLYLLLSGLPPFNGKDDAEILERVKLGKYDLQVPELDKVGILAKDLISKMLTDPDKRLSSYKVLEHPWMAIDKSSQILDLQQLKSFTQQQRLKKIMLTYIASQLQESEIIELGNLFKVLDTNGDGVLSFDEIKQGLKDNTKENELRLLMAHIDTDCTGTIQYTEFLAACIDRSIYLQQEKLYMAFKAFDLDGSGKISKHELQSVLGSEKNKGGLYWEGLIKEADENNDGEIDYNEFVEMMQRR